MVNPHCNPNGKPIVDTQKIMVKESKYTVTKILKSQRMRTVEESWYNTFTKQQMDKASSSLSAINLKVNVLSSPVKRHTVTECKNKIERYAI